jgi:hypothetical protein
MSNEKDANLTIRINRNLLQSAKDYARDSGISLSRIIRSFLEILLVGDVFDSGRNFDMTTFKRKSYTADDLETMNNNLRDTRDIISTLIENNVKLIERHKAHMRELNEKLELETKRNIRAAENRQETLFRNSSE